MLTCCGDKTTFWFCGNDDITHVNKGRCLRCVIKITKYHPATHYLPASTWHSVFLSKISHWRIRGDFYNDALINLCTMGLIVQAQFNKAPLQKPGLGVGGIKLCRLTPKYMHTSGRILSFFSCTMGWAGAGENTTVCWALMAWLNDAHCRLSARVSVNLLNEKKIQTTIIGMSSLGMEWNLWISQLAFKSEYNVNMLTSQWQMWMNK